MKQKMNYAPIVLFVYNRPWHTQQTVEALQKNELAEESELFIYSDAPKNEQEIENVTKVREYIKTINGFKKISIIERERNLGLADSIIDGVTTVINSSRRVIVMEDDLVSSPCFLNFMNKGLHHYQNNFNIFCITGYNFPPTTMEIPEEYSHDIYICPRNGSWGWATWENRWQKADWKIHDYLEFSQNEKIQKEFNYGGEDLSPMLRSQMEGKINSWSIRWCYAMFKHKGYCIYPIHSFIDNIGLDGSGVHCGEDRRNKIKNFVLNKKSEIYFPENIEVDQKIMKRFQDTFKEKNFFERAFQYLKKNVTRENYL